MWGNHTQMMMATKMMVMTRMAIFQNAPLQKSDNCEYEGGGKLSWGSQGGIGGGVSTITIDYPPQIRSWKVRSTIERDCF